MKTKKELQNEIDNLEARRREDIGFIKTFVSGIEHNNFDRMFLHELFEYRINLDMRKATRDIMQFITMNRHRWRLNQSETEL
jgi:hypothetical protein